MAIRLSITITMFMHMLSHLAQGWTPLSVTNDILVRMPGSQPGQVTLEAPNQCASCHFEYDSPVEPGTNWVGSMMAQAARDPVFWATMVVAAQDSIWALGNPNAADLCLRCHFPQGWLEGRSDPPDAKLMTGHDYDGVHCTVCHSMMDPFYADTFSGIREGADWTNYWDEVGTGPQDAAAATYTFDAQVAAVITFMNEHGFYTNDHPVSSSFTENAGGQMFLNVSDSNAKRAPFSDAQASHEVSYSRYHKSRYFCSTCHDVSNPVMANLGADPTNMLPSELNSAFSYGHVERTFSEFMLSAFGQQGGAPGSGAYAPEVFQTSRTNNFIASCQDCHMPDETGKACKQPKATLRPSGSTDHPESGAPRHDLTGGNTWIPLILASTVPGSPNYDSTNEALLVTAGATNLTLDFTQGLALNPDALISASQRAEENLQKASSITNLAYNPATGETSFRIVNHTGHKLISGYPEGRRVFANIALYAGGQLLHEVNPYDETIGTLKGLDGEYSPNSPALSPSESHHDELVFEAKMSSTLTGEEKTFHFALATGRYKDNRIPPPGFQYQQSGSRIVDPVWHGVSATNLFSTAEYAGGYRDVNMMLPSGGTQILVRLYYQTTSREYMEFLRDEINGTNATLSGVGAGGDPAYIVQTDPWFTQLKTWGDTMWQLWDHNKNLPGGAPVEMSKAELAAAYTPPEYVSLNVMSPYGIPLPSGTTSNLFGSIVTASVSVFVEKGLTQYMNTGWSMSSNSPHAGTTNSIVFTHTNDAALTWLWATNYWLNALTPQHGQLDVTSGWFTAGDVVAVTALPTNYYHFSEWTEDIPPDDLTNNPAAILMNEAKVIGAVFDANLATNQAPEWWLAIYYPGTNDFDAAALSDTDSDGMPAWAEYISGTIPTNGKSVLTAHTPRNQGTTITWPSVSGRVYSIAYSTNLISGFTVFTDAVNLAATPDLNTYTNAAVSNKQVILYRIGVRREE